MYLEHFTKSKSGHQHRRHNLWFKYQNLSQEIFCSQASIWLYEKNGKGDNSVMDLENFTKS